MSSGGRRRISAFPVPAWEWKKSKMAFRFWKERNARTYSGIYSTKWELLTYRADNVADTVEEVRQGQECCAFKQEGNAGEQDWVITVKCEDIIYMRNGRKYENFVITVDDHVMDMCAWRVAVH
jgi:hypothetical protein